MALPRKSLNMAVARCSDTHVILVDRGGGPTITNNAEAVIDRLNATLPGGIGWRRVYYRDTDGRFDELRVKEGRFTGFASCTDGQQVSLGSLAAHVPQLIADG